MNTKKELREQIKRQFNILKFKDIKINALENKIITFDDDCVKEAQKLRDKIEVKDERLINQAKVIEIKTLTIDQYATTDNQKSKEISKLNIAIENLNSRNSRLFKDVSLHEAVNERLTTDQFKTIHRNTIGTIILTTIIASLAISLIFFSTTACAADSPSIYASDGTYLGRLSDNPYEKDSIANPFNDYGSQFSDTSIKNPFGYGNEINYPDLHKLDE